MAKLTKNIRIEPHLWTTELYICSLFHPSTTEYIFYTVAPGTCFRINHRLTGEAYVCKYKRIKSIPYIIAVHNAMKL